MTYISVFCNVDAPVGKITDVIDMGDSIAFDLHGDDTVYSIRVNQVTENHFKGILITKGHDEPATLECEVYRYRNKITLIGKKWEYLDKSNYMWLVELEKVDDDLES